MPGTLSVYFLVPDLDPCGDAAAARVLANALPRDRFRVEVGVLGPAVGPVADELRAGGVSVNAVPLRHALDVNGSRRLQARVRAAGAAVIHAWGAMAARSARLVVSRGEEWNVPRFVVSGAAAPGSGLTGWLAARQLRRADRVIPATRADGERYRRLGVPSEQLTLVAPAAPAPGSSLDRSSLFASLGVPPGARVIAACGRTYAGFGPKEAIVAFDMLRYEFPALHLVVFGAGSDTPALEHFARALAFDDYRVRFVPCAPGRAAAIEVADVVLVTAPRGGVDEALQAMAESKPVVGWRTPDLSEVVDDRVTGVLVPFGDRAALAASTRSLIVDPEAAHRMGDAGRARAADRFGIARMAEQYARLYRELAGHGRLEEKGVRG